MRTHLHRLAGLLLVACAVLPATSAVAAERFDGDSVTVTGVFAAEAAWPLRGGAGITVAVIDDGIGAAPFFQRGDGTSRVVAEACFAVSCPDGTRRQIGPGAAAPVVGFGGILESHGTAVAGIVGGRAPANPDYLGRRGMAPEVDIVAVRVFGYDEGETVAQWSDVEAALTWISANRAVYGIDAVNISIGVPEWRTGSDATCVVTMRSIAALLAELHDAGVLVVAGAGNDGYRDGISYPACHPDVLGVGAVDDDDTLWEWSNHGGGVDLHAPGVAVDVAMAFLSSVGDRLLFGTDSGTSYAAPHVTGAAALLASGFPTVAITTIGEVLVDTARPGPAGTAILDVAAAAAALAAMVDTATRVFGSDRYDTAAALATNTYPDGADIVYISSGTSTVDALVAAGATAATPGPVLLVNTAVPAATAAALERLTPERIVVLGGPAAVPAAVLLVAHQAAAG